MQVLVTRPRAQSDTWVDALRQAGLAARALPLIDIQPVPAPQPVFSTAKLLSYGALMFVSANAAEHFFAQLAQHCGTACSLWHGSGRAAPRLYATGPGTTAALLRAGVDTRWIDAPPEDARQLDSEALWQRVSSQCVSGFRVLVVRGRTGSTASEQGAGRDWFASQVRKAQGEVDFCVVYQRVVPVLSAPELALARSAASDGSVWLFSSSEAVANLQALLPGQDWSGARAVASHPRIAEAARDAGFGTVRASSPRLEALVASIESLA